MARNYTDATATGRVARPPGSTLGSPSEGDQVNQVDQHTITIDVRGSHTARLPAERGTVHGAVSWEGPDGEEVLATVAEGVRRVQASVEERYDAATGPVTSYSFAQVRTWARRPHGPDGRELAPVRCAEAELTVEFCDLDDLSGWLAWSAGVTGLAVRHLAWDLTPERRRAAEREVRQQALREARTRAQDYADALDLGAVRIVSINDPEARHEARALALAGAVDGAPRLAPEDVEVSASVDARFVVGGPA
jgi:hypothetical protein